MPLCASLRHAHGFRDNRHEGQEHTGTLTERISLEASVWRHAVAMMLALSGSSVVITLAVTYQV